MKTHHVLGILWMTLCGAPSILFLWMLWQVRNAHPVAIHTLDFSLAVLLCLFALAGAVAGFPLFRGAQWARRFVGLIAVFTLIAAAVWFFAFGSLTSWIGIFSVLAIASVVLFFLPRHEPVA